MKKALLTLVAVLTSVTVFAQGTIVFNNIGGKAVKWHASAADIGKNPGANIVAADGILIQLLWLDNRTGEYVEVGTPVSAWPLGGAFNGGQRSVEVANTADPGWSWRIQASSAANPLITQVPMTGTEAGRLGGAVEFMSKTGDPVASISPQGMAGAIPEFQIGVVPEPSVIALGVLGVGALLLLRRRS